MDGIIEHESKRAPASVRRKAETTPSMTTAERLREVAVTERTEGFVRHEAEGLLEAILARVEQEARRGQVEVTLPVGSVGPVVTVVMGLLREPPHGFHVEREYDRGDKACLFISWGEETR